MASSFTLAELAQRIGAELRGSPEHRITGVATLGAAGPQHITFLTNQRYSRQLAESRAGAVILSEANADACATNALVCTNPHVAYARIATLFAPPAAWTPGINPSAVVAPDAHVDAHASVGPHCTVEAGAFIGRGARLGPGCVVGRDARVGADSHLMARVVVGDRCTLGERVLVQPGAVIGADGFGFADDNGIWVKVPQLGAVHIGDDVEIGANATVDRGAIDDTVIDQGVKIDNLVHVAHNCHIGAHTVIAACTAMAGSTSIGRHCAIGGAVGIGGHLSIADGVTLTGMAMVTKSLRNAGVYSSGLPAEANAEWHRTVAHVRQLPALLRRVKALEAAQNDKPVDTGEHDDG